MPSDPKPADGPPFEQLDSSPKAPRSDVRSTDNPSFVQDPPPKFSQSEVWATDNRSLVQDPPPKYSQNDVKVPVAPSYVNPSETAPKNQDSVIVRIKAAREESDGKFAFVKTCSSILLRTIGCTVSTVFFLAIPITMIVMGAIHLDDCPAERYIPIYLIVMGCFSAFKILISIVQRVRMHAKNDWDENEEEERSTKCAILDTIFGCFMIAWFIAGNVWIYRLYGNYNGSDVTAGNYCDETLYLFAFWITTVSYIIGMLSCCCISVGCVVLCCMKFSE